MMKYILDALKQLIDMKISENIIENLGVREGKIDDVEVANEE